MRRNMKTLFVIGAVLISALCASCAPRSWALEPTATPGLTDVSPPDVTDAPDETDARPFYLELSGERFTAEQTISYIYVNNTDERINVLAIPRLEKDTENGWLELPFKENVGFCGTPDGVAAMDRSTEWTLDVENLYGAPLEAGRYRLSFDVVDDDYEKFDEIFGEFEIVQNKD